MQMKKETEKTGIRTFPGGVLRRLNKYDAAALGLGLCLLAYFLYTARLGVGVPDEAFYYSIPQRLLKGDRLFVEEWHLTQMSSLFSVLPYWIYVSVTGGTRGMILYMRCAFIAADMLFYAYLYRKLRAYKLWGLLAAFLFCAVLPESSFAFNYYAVSSMAVTAVCVSFFVDEKRGAGKLTLMGAVFACGVLAEPLLVFLYLIYCLAALFWNAARKKGRRAETYSFLLHGRVWMFFTLGAVCAFVLFTVYLLAAGTFRDLPRTLPHLFTGTEFNKDNFVDFSKLSGVLRLFGWVGLVCSAACLGAAAYGYAAGRADEKQKAAVFLLTCIVFCLFCIFGVFRTFAGSEGVMSADLFLFYGVPVLLTGPTWFFLSGKKEPRLFLFWLTGALYSVFVDLSSSVMMGAGGRIAQIAALLCIGGILSGRRASAEAAAKRRRKSSLAGRPVNRRAFTAVFAVCAAVFLVWNLGHIGAQGFFKPMEYIYHADPPDPSPYGVTLREGPFANLKTGASIAEKYYASLRDMDRIRAGSQGGRLAVYSLLPYLYLYADLPYACISSWDQNGPERSLLYWDLLEEQRPEYIYIADFSFQFYGQPEEYRKDLLAVLCAEMDCEVTEGEAGYIVKVTGGRP